MNKKAIFYKYNPKTHTVSGGVESYNPDMEDSISANKEFDSLSAFGFEVEQ